MVRGALQGAWDRSTAAERLWLQRFRWLSPLALGLGLLALAVAYLEGGPPPTALLLPVLVTALWLLVWLKRRAMERDLARGRGALVPLLVASVLAAKHATSAAGVALTGEDPNPGRPLPESVEARAPAGGEGAKSSRIAIVVTVLVVLAVAAKLSASLPGGSVHGVVVTFTGCAMVLDLGDDE